MSLHALPQPTGDPWERRRTETDPAWQAFRTFRDMGSTRSYTRVATELHKSLTLMRRWAHTHEWKTRAWEWDSSQDADIRERLQVTRWQVAEKQLSIARQVQAKVLQAMKTLDPKDLSPADMAAWLKVSVQMERDVLFPKDESGANVAVSTGITVVIDPRYITPPTELPAPRVVDAD